jgi:hypothetical protein
VNLHVTNLILAALLLYPRHAVWSALALAVAVHLKASPVIMALAFVYVRDVRWLFCFAAWGLGIVAGTSAVDGFDRYVQFLHNAANIYAANGLAFRDNSFDSVVRATLQVIGADLGLAPTPVLILKAAVLIWALTTTHLVVRRGTFDSGKRRGSREAMVENAFVVLPFLMTLMSPLIWEHHPVFVIVPFMILFGRLETARELLIFAVAWASVFVVLTFDIYPFSYHRLVGLLLGLGLITYVGKRQRAQLPWIAALNQSLTVRRNTGELVRQ